MNPDEFEVRKLGYASNPWRVIHVPSDRQVFIPRTIQNGDGKDVHFSGPACFPRKRDALAWMRDELPRLLAQRGAA